MRYPEWLKKKVPKGANNKKIRDLLPSNVHTVCESALCPNRGECFSKNTVTFMILGESCSRNCRFCAVANGAKLPLDPHEPQAVAKAAKDLNLDYIVITSVTRDDLSDGGAAHFAETISAIKDELPSASIEVLTPDFQGNQTSIKTVLDAFPTVFNHNIETIERLYSEVRPQANYQQSLNVLKYAKENSYAVIKSGFMLGLGETEIEVKKLLKDLKAQGVDIITIGQYIAPSKNHYPVKEFIHPEKFTEYKKYGEEELGIKYIFAGPFVRSSYMAKDTLKEIKVSSCDLCS
jgi:lipoic acid synthetase